MTKLELTAAILERLHDPYDSVPDEDIATLDFLTLDQAAGYLADLRRDEDAADLEPEERLPQEVTPELYMEVWNCDIRRCRHAVQKTELAEPVEPNVIMTFINIKEGRTYQETCSPEKVVKTIWRNLNDQGIVLTHIKQSSADEDYDDEFEIVADMTDADPLADLSIKGATELIAAASELGYNVPPTLTPGRFLTIYYSMQPKAKEE